MFALAWITAACGGSEGASDPWLENLQLASVLPSQVLPGTRIELSGEHFVGPNLGKTTLELRGSFVHADGEEEVVISVAEPEFVDFDRLQFWVGTDLLATLPSQVGTFTGTAELSVRSNIDGRSYTSPELALSLEFASELEPILFGAQDGGIFYVNDAVALDVSGLLLAGTEGTTTAVISGCVQRDGQSDCIDIEPQAVPVTPSGAFDRRAGSFSLVPAVAGIGSGSFRGEVALSNVHQSGVSRTSQARRVEYELLAPRLFSVSPAVVSLGQYVELDGGGFVGGVSGGASEVYLTGEFLAAGSTSALPVDHVLVPEFVSGRRLRYVVNEDDELGRDIDFRRDVGAFEGEVRVVTSFQGQQEVGPPVVFSFEVAPVKQVVYLRFLPDYVDSLRHFGLRAVDAFIRERVKKVVERDYATVNLEVRLEPPEDFALYSVVEVAGEDKNGIGLLGYDNTPGKDMGNFRLHDRIGGVNAQTQQDGYPGYGGVFIESLFSFSEHPKGRAMATGATDPAFDQIFDLFRPDLSDKPVRSSDLPGGTFVVPEQDPGCPAPSSDRIGSIRCAVWVLGSLIGTTLSHEIGHSLGLANPYSENSFHNTSDELNRLMDNGGDRPFRERAELYGEGPGRFCVESYEYLRDILPTSDEAELAGRPSCF